VLHGRGAFFDVCDAVVARRNANQAVSCIAECGVVAQLNSMERKRNSMKWSLTCACVDTDSVTVV
jgi:hypothetical protein